MAEVAQEHRIAAIHACADGPVPKSWLSWALTGKGDVPSPLVRRVAGALADLGEREYARGRASAFKPSPRREVYGKLSQPIRKLLTKERRPMTIDEICTAIGSEERRKVGECCASMASDGYVKRTGRSTFKVMPGKEVRDV